MEGPSLPRPTLPGDPPLRVIGHGPAHPAGQAARALGRAVRDWRAAHGVAPADLARRLRTEPAAVVRLDAGTTTPGLATLERLARATGLVFTLRIAAGRIDVAIADTNSAGASDTGTLAQG